MNYNNFYSDFKLFLRGLKCCYQHNDIYTNQSDLETHYL